MVEWQHQNEASIHRPVKEFADDRKCVREWCQCYSTLKGETRGVLGKCRCVRCGQRLSVDLDHRVSGGQEKQRQISVESVSVTVCNIPMSTSRHGPRRGGIFVIGIRDERWFLGFHIVNFPNFSSNIPLSPAYGVYISQLVRMARIHM